MADHFIKGRTGARPTNWRAWLLCVAIGLIVYAVLFLRPQVNSTHQREAMTSTTADCQQSQQDHLR